MTRLHTTICRLVLSAYVIAWGSAQTLAVPNDAACISVLAEERPYAAGELVRVPLPKSFSVDSSIDVVAANGQTAWPAQIVDSTFRGERSLWFRLDKTLARGTSRKFEIVPSSKRSDPAPTVDVRDSGKALVFFANDRPVLQYNTAIVSGPKPEFSRSGFIHPVYTPNGAVLTDGMPKQHTHQHGIMFAWVRTTFGGEEIDFWNCHRSRGRVKHVEVIETHTGPFVGEATVRLSHYLAEDADHPPSEALNETWTIRVFRVEAVTKATPFIWEIEITQYAVEKPLVVNQYHYGGLGIRGSADWMRGDAVKFLTADGKNRQNGNHTRPAWTAIYDNRGGPQASLTVLNANDNFRGPQWTRLHPSLPYFCFLPVVENDFRITTSERYTAKFRFVAADSQPHARHLDTLRQEFEQAPIARIQPIAPIQSSP